MSTDLLDTLNASKEANWRIQLYGQDHQVNDAFASEHDGYRLDPV
jgi:hypothetical protein